MLMHGHSSNLSVGLMRLGWKIILIQMSTCRICHNLIELIPLSCHVWSRSLSTDTVVERLWLLLPAVIGHVLLVAVCILGCDRVVGVWKACRDCCHKLLAILINFLTLEIISALMSASRLLQIYTVCNDDNFSKAEGLSNNC